MAIKLKTLKFKNIGRFVDLQVLDLASLPNLSQIDGKNLNTDGSSGSGKSTIFQALEYVFGVNEVPTTVLQSRLTKDGIFVEVELDKDGEMYTVSRSKTDGLSIKTPTDFIEGSNKIAEELLQNIVGIPSNLLRKVFHKRQNEGGFFVGLTPKESYEFLTETLDLTSWSKKQVKLGEKNKEALAVLTSLQNSLTTIESKLEGTNSVLNSLQEPILLEPKEAYSNKAIALTLSIDQAQQKIKTYQEAKQAQIQELKVPVPPTIPVLDLSSLTQSIVSNKQKYNEALSAQNQQKQQLNSDLSNQKTALSKIQRAKSDIADCNNQLEGLKQQIISIKSSICPTCEQNWVTDQANIVLNNKIEDFKSLMSKIEVLNALVSTEDAVTEQIKKIESDISLIVPSVLNPILEEIATVEKQAEKERQAHQAVVNIGNASFYEETKKYTSQKAEIENAWNQQLSLASQELSSSEQQKRDIENTLSFHESKLKTYRDQIESVQTTVRTLQIEKNVIDSKINEQKHLVNVLTTSESLIKSYVNQLFQGSLEQIANRANEILSSIPNAQTIAVGFDGYKETKSGSIKEEITTYVYCDGEAKIPLKSLSGGERTSVELAVDLSVIELIESTTGKGIDILVLDEPFTGLDSVSACSVVDMLMMSNLTKKIILVDHNDTTKSRITSKITVVRSGQESRIE